ncbi:CPBP family intramembrane glutamic endopeptidase [Streptomyces yaizuensis]|uniref:CPBP family intramembrane metalloprotease n=1 Tax=Streptomyces yaizuensis TaxID=2989713 RepID=A0ABQ5P6A3_9ACTN|nr:CPBP family intramembrane glutamic endopeptidase [Streptomyces sp. YSPA8]GLF98111.1 CPBP family intramembrane metalloprotease [Streptomyces sp. YSPA8]
MWNPNGHAPGHDTLSAAHAYGDVVRLLAVAATPMLWSSGLALARLLGAEPSSRWTAYGNTLVHTGAPVGAGIWLLALIATRTCGHRAPARLGRLVLAAAVAAADVTQSVTSVNGGAVTPLRLASAVLLAWLAGELLTARGIGPGRVGLTRRPEGGSAGDTWLAYLAALAVTGAVTAFLRTHGPGPVPRQGQEAALGYDGTTDLLFSIPWGVVAEELVVTACVITLLRAAGRPVWEWAVIPVVVRVAGHLYLGTPALAQLILATVAVCLFARHRRIVPLLAAHALYNTAALIGLWSIGAGLLIGCTIALREAIVRVGTKAPGKSEKSGHHPARSTAVPRPRLDQATGTSTPSASSEDGTRP